MKRSIITMPSSRSRWQLDHQLREAGRFGADAVWLGVCDRNTRAREFYRRWGFVDVGTQGSHFGGRVFADPMLCLVLGPPPDARG